MLNYVSDPVIADCLCGQSLPVLFVVCLFGLVLQFTVCPFKCLANLVNESSVTPLYSNGHFYSTEQSF